MDTKERILTKAKEMFFRFGVKSVTMDDIARELGISKKTIYQHFADKDDLVLQFTVAQIDKDKAEHEAIKLLKLDAIQKLLEESERMRKSMTEMNPAMIFEIQKYHPKSWKVFHDFLQEFALGAIIEDIQSGMAQGLFRQDTNPALLARLRLEQIEMAFNIQIFPLGKFNPIQIQETFLYHFVRGILTPKGHEYFNTLSNKQ
jgi:AcrR family transcriptional regulator